MAMPGIGRAALPFISRAASTTYTAGRNYVVKNAPRAPFKEAVKGSMKLGWEVYKYQTGRSSILGRHSAMVAPYLMERRYP